MPRGQVPEETASHKPRWSLPRAHARAATLEGEEGGLDRHLAVRGTRAAGPKLGLAAAAFCPDRLPLSSVSPGQPPCPARPAPALGQ